MSLRLRLALFGAAVVALTLIAFGALLYALLAHGASTNQDDALRSRAHEAVVSLDSAAGLTARAPVAPADLRSSTEIFVEVFDSSWTVIYATAQISGYPPQPSARLLDAAPKVSGGSFDTDKGVRYYALPFHGGFVVTGQSIRVVQSNLSGVVGFLVISGVPTLIAALAASWLVAGRALKPLKEVAGTADDIGRARDFGRRLPQRRSRDEVALLSTSFNRMLEQLQDSFDSQRRFVADASHELRTPLSTIQGNAGLLARGPDVSEEVRRAAAADIAAETARMTRLVERMLTLAKADSGSKLDLAPVELGPLVVEVCRQARSVHPDREVVSSATGVAIAGDEDALRQLIWILLDNALRHSRTRVTATLASEGAWARLTVADDGPGIPIEEREHVFERFYRSDRSRTGHGAGLGLSIARWIVEQHEGRILAGGGPDGGAAMYVDLPLSSGGERGRTA